MDLGRPYSNIDGRVVDEESFRVQTKNGQEEQRKTTNPLNGRPHKNLHILDCNSSTRKKMETPREGLCLAMDETCWIDRLDKIDILTRVFCVLVSAFLFLFICLEHRRVVSECVDTVSLVVGKKVIFINDLVSKQTRKSNFNRIIYLIYLDMSDEHVLLREAFNIINSFRFATMLFSKF